MRKPLLVAGAVLWSAAMFGAGALYEAHRLLSQPLVAAHGLELQASGSTRSGQLPAGTTLYKIERFGEPLFAVFLTTKDMAALTRRRPEHWLEVIPLTAWEVR